MTFFERGDIFASVLPFWEKIYIQRKKKNTL